MVSAWLSQAETFGTEDEMSKVELNQKAPDFSLLDFKGNPFILSDQLGHPVLLVFNRGFA